MYYNSNKVSNDYYNAYKREISKLKNDRRRENIKRAIQLILFFVLFTLLLLASFYFYHYYNPKSVSQKAFSQKEELFFENNSLAPIIIKEEELPVSVQLTEINTPSSENIVQNGSDTVEKEEVIGDMNQKDIELIVKIIMSKMNEKVEKPLEEQLQEANKKVFKKKSLKESNHYNKVILTQNKIAEVKNSSLIELNNNLQNLINEDQDNPSNYREEIKKEMAYRKNEMRIIIVQEGDTLSQIAKRAYGNHTDYKKIFAANPEIIQDPNQIYVGQRLRIPS